MAPKVIVLKVCITCDKCKAKLLKAVARLEGVNKIETDEEKGTLTVVGPVDPYDVVACARKVCAAEIMSIGDPKKPEPEKNNETKPNPCCTMPCRCRMHNHEHVVHPFHMPAPHGPHQGPWQSHGPHQGPWHPHGPHQGPGHHHGPHQGPGHCTIM